MLNKAEIDRFLIRPLPVGLQLITAKIDFDGLNKMFLAGVIFVLGFSHCRINWTPARILYFPVTLVIACIIRFCMIWIASCASFWLGGIKNSLNYFVLTIGEMAKYPLTIYPAVLKYGICLHHTLRLYQLFSGQLSAGKERQLLAESYDPGGSVGSCSLQPHRCCGWD